jgi:hypothetical protein
VKSGWPPCPWLRPRPLVLRADTHDITAHTELHSVGPLDVDNGTLARAHRVGCTYREQPICNEALALRCAQAIVEPDRLEYIC